MKSSLDRLTVEENNLKTIKFSEIILFFFLREPLGYTGQQKKSNWKRGEKNWGRKSIWKNND